VAGSAEYAGRQLILSETPRAPVRPAPLLGADTDDVLASDADLDRSALAGLRAEGVI
jgi:crotonobetainyl-CoA:carnitine CoA-transferase CaiB-like acyl-CoA transferase